VGFTAKILAHGAAGGVMSSLQGGKFGNGFLSAGVAEAASPGIDRLDSQNPIGQSISAQRVIAAAIVGGTTSVIAGSKFGNGALTAAFGRAFNEEAKIRAAKKKFPPFEKLEENYPRSDDGKPVQLSSDDYARGEQCSIRLYADWVASGGDTSIFPQGPNIYTSEGYLRDAKTFADSLWKAYGPPTITTLDGFAPLDASGNYTSGSPAMSQQGIFYQYGPTGGHIDIFYQGQAGTKIYGGFDKVWYWKIP
jgi:hypothetical protein